MNRKKLVRILTRGYMTGQSEDETIRTILFDGLDGIDLASEYALIKQKQSRLSRAKRDSVCAAYEYMTREGEA